MEVLPSIWQLDENFEILEVPGIDKPASISTPVALYARSESRFDLESVNVVIAVVELPTGMNLNDFVTGNLQQLEENPTFSLIDSYETNLSGIPAHTIVNKRGPELSYPQPLQISQTYLVHNDKGYIITYSASTDFEKYFQAAQEIIKSFKLI